MMTTEDMQEFDADQRFAQGEPDEVVAETERIADFDADPAYAEYSIEERNQWIEEYWQEHHAWLAEQEGRYVEHRYTDPNGWRL